MIPSWLLVAGDVRASGGMDRANHALASYIARSLSADLHLVTHAAAADLEELPNVRVHRVPRPFGAHRAGQRLLRASAARVRRGVGRTARAVTNGGNANLSDAIWVHYVHAAFEPRLHGWANRLMALGVRTRYVREEDAALAGARVVLCNSRRTAADVARSRPELAPRTRVVYYGTDPSVFRAPSADERDAARAVLGRPADRPLALFCGALGDGRKNFDTLLAAWTALCSRRDWDVDLLVAGTGAGLQAWKRRVAAAGLSGRIDFLGYRHDVAVLLAACDLLVHPARYEPYGLAVHEALCRCVPAIVSAAAGVAELYPPGLNSLLMQDPDSADELSARLLGWRTDSEVQRRTANFAAALRARTWDDMARDVVAAIATA